MVQATIYTAPKCPHSKAFKEFLDGFRVSYDEKNILSSQDAAIELKEKSGQMAVPTVLIDNEVFIGFDRRTERRIKRHLGV